MNRKEPTKTFMTISNWKNPFDRHGLYRNISALKRLRSTYTVYVEGAFGFDLQRQTAVSAYLKSKQLLLFVFACLCRWGAHIRVND